MLCYSAVYVICVMNWEQLIERRVFSTIHDMCTVYRYMLEQGHTNTVIVSLSESTVRWLISLNNKQKKFRN